MKNKKLIIPLVMVMILLVLIAVLASTSVLNLIGGRVHFPDEFINKNLIMKDGKTFRVLRRLQVDGKNSSSTSMAVFIVRFKFSSLDLGINKRLSMIPAPFLMGMDGFREKYWTFDEQSGFFQGIYQWESMQHAEAYPDSFIYSVMVKRSAPGTLSYEIMPNTDLSELIKKLSSGDR